MKQTLVFIDNHNRIKEKLAINFISELRENYPEERLFWVIITDHFHNNELEANSLKFAKLAQEQNFILRNNIQYFHPQHFLEQDQLISTTTSILMLAKSKKYHFNKDPIREEPMWKGVEWGGGKRKNGKNPYNEKGKDPGNFWVYTEKNDDYTETLFTPLDPEEVIERILLCSGNEEDELHIFGQHSLFDFDKMPFDELRKPSYYNMDLTDEIDYKTSNTILNPKINRSEANQIYHSSSDIMSEVNENSVKTIVTSPPYWGLRDYGHEDEYGKEKKYETYLQNINRVWKECYRVLQPSGTFWLNINTRMKRGDIVLIPVDFIEQCRKIGFKLYNIIYWHKRASVAGLTESNVVDKFEYILVFYKGNRPYLGKTTFGSDDFNLNFDKEINAWVMDQLVGSLSKDIDKMVRGRKEIPGHGKLKYPHTALFPTDLVERVVEMTTDEGDIVLDPFMGTGTTAEVAKLMDRKYIGYEINKEYGKIIKYRLQKVEKNLQQKSLDAFV